MRPNIFNYATSELSQDAFFCWLLEWSKEEYVGEELNTTSLRLINYILEKTNGEKVTSVKQIEIIKQEAKIDFYAKINNNTIILFESKTETQFHDDQLSRYRKYIENKYRNYQISCVYIKSGITWKNERKYVAEANYFVLDNIELLSVFKNYENEDLCGDFAKSVLSKLDIYNSYNSLQFNEWKNNATAWLGFYSYLENKIDGSGVGFWAGGKKTWFTLVNHYWYDSEMDTEIDISLVMERRMITIDANPYEDVDAEKCQKYLTEIICRNNFMDIEGSFLNPISKNNKNIRIVTIPDILIQDLNDVINVEEITDKIMGIINKFNNCLNTFK